MNITGSMFVIDDKKSSSKEYQVQTIIFDAIPVMKKHLPSVSKVLGRYVQYTSDSRFVEVLSMDTIKDMIVDVFSCFDESDEKWRQAINRSQIFPDFMSIKDMFPNAQIVFDNNEINSNILVAELATIENLILGDLVWWINTLSPIPRQFVNAIQVLKITSSGIVCNIHHLYKP